GQNELLSRAGHRIILDIGIALPYNPRDMDARIVPLNLPAVASSLLWNWWAASPAR
ncbi:MAG: hypothetical protein H6P96_598, partial [Candidatus Aminicenantes bacterium]|nr:hypothetical protein [Candidatus Aminicenantes bacterium]